MFIAASTRRGYARSVHAGLVFALCAVLSACSLGREPAVAAPVDMGGVPRVEPGDRITLEIFEEEEMSDTFTVSTTGEAVLPKLGAVRVAGSEIGALQDSLRQAYGRYLRNPAVEVTVLRRVGVHGEVREPGLYLVDLTMTLRDLIAKAGGITESGDPRKIYIDRGDQRIQLGTGVGTSIPAAELRSGDQVMVGQRPWIQRNSLAFASTAAVVVSLVVPIVRDMF